MDVTCETQPRVEPATAFELKGTVTPVTVLCLHTADVERIVDELRVRIAPVPQMFLNAPVVIDLGEVRELDIPLDTLAERLRACKLVPVGVAHASVEQVARAAAAGLAILQLSRQRATESKGDAKAEPKGQTNGHNGQTNGHGAAANGQTNPAALAPMTVSTLTVRQPVRSGQVIYAQRADLVVLGPVNPGAQVIADGHIHVYGPLRGRALAGAQGLAEARVFCQSLEAELVSVNGQYLTADEIPAERRQRPSQIFVEDGSFRILPL
jgi:septum site-determining protein MinC